MPAGTHTARGRPSQKIRSRSSGRGRRSPRANSRHSSSSILAAVASVSARSQAGILALAQHTDPSTGPYRATPRSSASRRLQRLGPVPGRRPGLQSGASHRAQAVLGALPKRGGIALPGWSPEQPVGDRVAGSAPVSWRAQPQDFDKIVFQLPIPRYDPEASLHTRLVELARRGRGGGATGAARGQALRGATAPLPGGA